ncbi:hypothetical protein J4450_00410 [Candidatus Micrarchaeota archaeon]|nr:hypothetical protein [Candidatus Micrarchaeota archaeon]
MGIKPLLILVVFLLIIGTSFAQYSECGIYAPGTISQDMCNTMHTFRSFLGPSIMLLILSAAVLYTLGQSFGAETRAKATIWAENLAIAAFIAIIIYVVFTEQNIVNLLTGKFPPPYFKHIIVALLFGVIWVVLFYLPGQVLQHPPLQLAAKEELGVLIMSIVILISWVTITQLFTDISTGIIAQSTPGLNIPTTTQTQAGYTYLTSHLDVAYGSLEIFFVKLRTHYTSLYLFEVLIGFLSTVSFPIGSPFPAVNIISFSLMPFDGLILLANAHTVVVEAIGYLMSVIWAKEFIVIFARDAIPTILLPFGLIMRAFPWFRATGSSLIAICIVVYFIYPLSIMFSNYLVFDIFKPALFLFTPNEDAISFYNDPGLTDAQRADKLRHMQDEAKEESSHFLDHFQKDKDIIQRTQVDKCNYLPRFLCSVWNVITGTASAIVSFVGTVVNIWITMMTFSGDWLMNLGKGIPLGSSGGLYKFIIEEVVAISQFIILVTITSVIEIIITITMYRNISELIGGEVEIMGLTKLV